MKRWINISLRPVIVEEADFGSALGDIAAFTAEASGFIDRRNYIDGTMLAFEGEVAGAVTRKGTADGTLAAMEGEASRDYHRRRNRRPGPLHRRGCR